MALRRLTREDFAEGLAMAIADAERSRAEESCRSGCCRAAHPG